MLAYLTYMAERLEHMHRLLKPTASLYYHCDPNQRFLEVSKKLEKHCAMMTLYFFSYNHVKPHGAVRTKRNNRITPAMAAGIATRPATIEELVALIVERAPAVKYAKTYQKRQKVATE